MSAFESWHAVWQMGGDGFYVWLAYGLVLGLLIGQAVIGGFRWVKANQSSMDRSIQGDGDRPIIDDAPYT